MRPERDESERTRPALVLREHAADDLRFIRDTMAQASGRSAFPGVGTMVIGAVALAASAWAADAPGATAWLARWLVGCVLSMAIGAMSMAFKTRASGPLFVPGVLRRFALVLTPPIVAGALLTVRFQSGGRDVLPGIWLLLYGVGLTCGGALSVAAVRAMGIAFMAIGAAALFVPGHGDLWMAIGFGGLHVGFGAWIARRHGG